MNLAQWLEALLQRDVHDRIESDPRSVADTLMGCPKHRVFKEVIGSGQADFDCAVALHVDGKAVMFSADDRALFYAKYNQPRHLDELRHAFEHLSPGRSAADNMLDIGCGPFTAGLVYASVVGAGEPFRYYGVDRAASMRNLAQRLFEGARLVGGVHADTRAAFFADLASVHCDPPNWGHSLAVISYLLGSPTVDAAPMAEAIAATLNRIGPGPQSVLHINSAHGYANRKYPEFRDALIRHGFALAKEDEERFMDTNKGFVDISYALLHRPKQEIMNMERRDAIT
ncbi:hypothetical protein [Lysobacter sp. CA199]|uniref:hypothetical protein n=1 Tax=Lysobacter sp. CA199 TaxID=3455608 RepID=UPI003F8D6FC6